MTSSLPESERRPRTFKYRVYPTAAQAGTLDARIDHTGHRIVTRSPDMAGRPVVICTICNVRLPAEVLVRADSRVHVA